MLEKRGVIAVSSRTYSRASKTQIAQASTFTMRYVVTLKESQLSDPVRVFSRHPNGSGRIGRYVTIQDTVLVDESSTVDGQCELYQNCKITENSQLRGFSRMSGCSIATESRFDQLVQLVDKSISVRSKLNGDISLVGVASVTSCDLRTATGQQIRIIDSDLTSVTAFGSAWVSNAQVYGCELLPGTRLYSGRWNRSPRVVRSSGQYDLTEAENDQITIGCMTRPIAVWRKLSPEVWLQIGYTADELDEIAALIRAW